MAPHAGGACLPGPGLRTHEGGEFYNTFFRVCQISACRPPILCTDWSMISTDIAFPVSIPGTEKTQKTPACHQGRHSVQDPNIPE
jgi:hypothetical protein